MTPDAWHEVKLQLCDYIVLVMSFWTIADMKKELNRVALLVAFVTALVLLTVSYCICHLAEAMKKKIFFFWKSQPLKTKQYYKLGECEYAKSNFETANKLFSDLTELDCNLVCVSIKKLSWSSHWMLYLFSKLLAFNQATNSEEVLGNLKCKLWQKINTFWALDAEQNGAE